LKGLLRIFGLAAALGLVSLSTVEAGSGLEWAWEPCAYYCDGNGPYQTWTSSYGECCSGSSSVLVCPPGETASPGWWGGHDYQVTECMW
jgi:hypothetical protein